ncbi:MAG: sugar porter family MFS transporter [Chitinophagaceae bacterium]
MQTSNDSSTARRTQFICFTVALGGLLFGFDTAVISGALQPLKTQFSFDATMEGWLVSSGLVGCILGVLITGMLSDRIGRKKTILIAGWTFLLSAIGCAVAPSATILIISRMLGGIGVGMASMISPMYIAEFAPAASRGRMVAYYQLAITIGILLAYLSNALLAHFNMGFTSEEIWRPMFFVMAIPSAAFLFLLVKIPESPRWLVSKGRMKEASDIMHTVRTPELADKEIRDIEKAATAKPQNASAPQSISLSSPQMRIPLLIGILLAVFQQFSGINAIIYYGPSIFEAAGMDSSNALLSQVIIGSVNLFSTIIAIKWVDQIGRKKLLSIGLTGIVISLILCGVLFYTNNTQGPWLLILMLVFICCFAFSLGPITWIIINEIFPGAVRVKAVALCTLMLWVAVWMVGQFVPWLLEKAGPAMMFWIFAIFSLCNFFFSWKVVKETSGKTLEEMEEVFVAPH